MEVSYVRGEKETNLAIIRITRPEKLNALDKDTVGQLATLFKGWNDESDTTKRPKVAIITGAGGKAFSAGVDLSNPINLNEQSREDNLHKNPIYQMEQFKGVIIAAVDGYCITGGLELALACDFIVATKRSIFRDTHSKFGLVPLWGMSVKLPRVVGHNHARFMSLTSLPISAEKAMQYGLVSIIVEEPDLLMKQVIDVANTIIQLDFEAVVTNKQLIQDGFSKSYEQGLIDERKHSLNRAKEIKPVRNINGKL